MTVAKATPWPQAVLNVTDLGADPTDQGDSTPALRQALEQTKEGGVVFLPRGRYRITDGLELPPRTVLRGEGLRPVWLWPGARPLLLNATASASATSWRIAFLSCSESGHWFSASAASCRARRRAWSIMSTGSLAQVSGGR